MRHPDALTLPSSFLDRLAPFCARWSGDGTLVYVSSALRKYWCIDAPVELSGVQLRWLRPLDRVVEARWFKELVGMVLDLALDDPSRPLRGEILRLPLDQGWLFTGLPTVRRAGDLASYGLSLSDFPSHHGMGELLLANESTHMMLETTVSQQQELTTLNDELRRQIAVRSEKIFKALVNLARAGTTGTSLQSGDLVAGRYRVIRHLGSGAMGEVFEVVSTEDGSRWALKTGRGLDASGLARLAREAHLGSQLRHPNLVGIRDIDISAEGFLFIVMELVDGETLRERLRREQRLPLEDASRILSGVARGLAALHRARVAHRDLKPSNVLLAREPHDMVKLSDFGIARPMEARRESTGEASVPSALEQPVQRSHLPSSSAADPTATAEAAWPDGAGPNQPGLHGPASPQQEVTRTGMISGTPRYIAPELVLNGGRAEPAGDIFGMGVMFYELLTGQHPFDEPPVHTVANGGKPHRGPLPDSVKLHPPLARLLVRALDVSSSNRPSAREFAETLETWLGTTSS